MLQPWVPVIALFLAWTLLSLWAPQVLVGAGGLLLALALLSQARAWGTAWRARRRNRQVEKRMLALDWKLIDNSVASARPKQDCERPETLGVCTGPDCMVYKTCNFNIKRPLP
jgi:hypothetical protein